MRDRFVNTLPLMLSIAIGGCASRDTTAPHLADPRPLPQSAEELVAWSPTIVIGSVNAVSETLTISDTIDAEWLTAEAPVISENEDASIRDFTSYDFEISDILTADQSFDVEDVIALWVAGHDRAGSPPTIGASYVVFAGETASYHPANAIEPLGGTYGLIIADDLQGPVSYAHGEKPSWAAGMTVQDLIDDIEDELDN